MADIDAIIQAAIAKHSEAPASVVEVEAPAEQNEAQAPAVEAVESPAPEVKAEEPKELESAKFAKLAEREKQFRQLEKKFADQETRLNAKMAELEAKESKLKNPNTLLDMLEAAGMTPEEFQRKILVGDINVDKPQLDPVQEKLKLLEKELEAQKEFRASLENQRRQEAANNFVTEYKGKLRSAAARYENLNEYFDNVDEIVDVAVKQADAYAAQYNEAPDVEDVLSQLDAYYGKHVQKFKTKYASVSTAVKQAAKAESKEPSKTMTNSHTQAASGNVPKYDPMDVAKGKISRDEWINYNLKKLSQ